MFFRFIGDFILLTWVFQILTIVFVLPFSAAFFYFTRNKSAFEIERAATQYGMQEQIALSVAFAGFAAILSQLYASRADYSWVYGLFGFVVTWLRLSENHYDKIKKLDTISSSDLPPGKYGVVRGAKLGILAALVVYPLCYFWPYILTVIPGTMTILTWALSLMDWLNGFWVIRWVIAFFAVGYLIRLGWLSLITVGLMLVSVKRKGNA